MPKASSCASFRCRLPSRGESLRAPFSKWGADVTEERIAALYDDCYRDEPFVRRPLGRWPEVATVSGSNYVEVGFCLGEVSGGSRTLTCFAALDNLIKGGAGQAIQNMNLVLGLDEGISLVDPG